MAVNKKKNTNGLVNRRVIIVVCVFVLVFIPLVAWVLDSKAKNSEFNSYQADKYTFYYPKDWTLTKMAMQNVNGTAFYLAPLDSGPPKTPHVYVEVAPANTNSISDMTAAFTVFKYTKANAVVDGIQAQKYTTVVSSSEGTLHSIAYVFIGKGNIYLIKLGYKQQATDIQLENEFSQIVTTLTLH